MNKFKKIFLRYWRYFTGKNVFPDAKHVITEAFVCDGKPYYRFDSIFNLPYQRGLAAIMVYEELRMKCDYELVKSFIKANEKIFSGTKFGMKEFAELKRMNDIMKERLDWVIDTDIVYKLASVVYFDASESPYHYDSNYAAAKVERWKKAEGINDFFLREPIQSLIPFLKGVQVNFEEYSVAQKEITQNHRTTFSQTYLGKSGESLNNRPSQSSAEVTQQK